VIIAQFIIGLSTILLLFFLFSPIYAATFYLLVRPLIQPYAHFGYALFGQVPLTALLPVILIASSLVNRVRRADYTIVNRQILPLYLMLYFSSLSFVNTPDLVLSLGHSLKIFTAISLYILVYNGIKNDLDLNRLLWVYMLCTIAPMIVGYYQFFTATGHAWKGPYYAGRRIDSLLMEYNAYGEFLCVAICSGLMLFFRSTSKRSKCIVGVLIFSLLANLVLSLNRGSWICLLAALLAAAPFYRKRIKISLLIGLCFLALLAASPIIYHRFMELSVVTEFGTRNTLHGRITGWLAILPLIEEHLLIGHGIGAIDITLERSTGTAYAPHNDYIRLLAEGGLFTFLAFVWFHLRNIAGCLLQDRYHRWQINYPLLVLIFYFASLSFFQNIIYNVVVFPMFAGLLALGHRAGQIAVLAKDTDHDFV